MKITFQPDREDENKDTHTKIAVELFDQLEDELLNRNIDDAPRVMEYIILSAAKWIEDCTVHSAGQYRDGDLRLDKRS